MKTDLQTAEHLWPSLSTLLFVPHTEQEYVHLVQILDALIDVVGEDEAHPLASLMDVLGVLIQEYENQHVPEITAT
jgi:HTH-type transcriptional regulator / antitoxin HigA